MPGAPAEVGSTANNYQILARLAVGGMAEIFLARGASAAGVERYCVLKRILRNRANDAHFVRMFLDEARLAAQLNHPNVAQVYDIGKLGDSYFFTMEYVHGETVRAVLQRARSLRRELPIGTILTIVAGAAAGLHHAHDRLGLDGRPLNIVHRDVSPSNLMASFEGGVKVVDFGVAKAEDRMSETRSGTVKGKISYLSPEQARGARVDRRTDMFALGIVMWEMLTTERLFRRASDFENMSAIVNEPSPPPSSRRPSIPPVLDAITLKLLAKNPADRYQTGAELVEALEEAAAATGSMISSSALGKLLREMFGQRPEPWLELEPQEVPEGVTVTSEPVPSEIDMSLVDSVDLQLSGVPDLSSGPPRAISHVDAVSRPVAQAPSSAQQITSQLRVPGRAPGESSERLAMAPGAVPVGPMRSAGSGAAAVPAPMAPAEPSMVLPLPPPPTMPEILPHRAPLAAGPNAPTIPDVNARLSAQSMPAAGGPVSAAASGPLPVASSVPAVPGSGRHSMPSYSSHGSGRHAMPGAAVATILGTPGSGRLSMPSLSGSGSALPSAPVQAEPEERQARGWPMIAVIAAAALIGSLTVGIIMKTGGEPAPASMPSAAGAASGSEVEPRPAPVAAPAGSGGPAMSGSGAATVEAAKPEPIQVPDAAIQAAEPVAVDAAAAAPAAASPDAAVPGAEPAAASPPQAPKKPRREPRDLKEPKDAKPAPPKPRTAPAPSKPEQDVCATNPMACQH